MFEWLNCLFGRVLITYISRQFPTSLEFKKMLFPNLDKPFISLKVLRNS